MKIKKSLLKSNRLIINKETNRSVSKVTPYQEMELTKTVKNKMISFSSSIKMERFINKTNRQIKPLKILKAISPRDLHRLLLKFKTLQIIIYISR